ncbi:MAG: response regulator [Chloroflexi bacterium]|nr:response regulator [Chloroflexota bacterium]
MVVGDYLESLGYALTIAMNGREALEKAMETQPDIILMDIQMPVMDGLEATRQLRADPHFADVPIIALTALAMNGDRERCLEAGATDYISKPVSLKKLKEMIERLLNGTKQKQTETMRFLSAQFLDGD